MQIKVMKVSIENDNRRMYNINKTKHSEFWMDRRKGMNGRRVMKV